MRAEPPAWARVVDTSALAAVVFDEPEADEVARRLEGVLLVAPTLMRFELASVCRKKLRRHAERREALLAAHAVAEQVEVHEVEVRFQEVVELAESESLTVYDATYVWLARKLDLELVTLDRRLATAAAGSVGGDP